MKPGSRRSDTTVHTQFRGPLEPPGEPDVCKDEATMIENADGDIQATELGQLAESHLTLHLVG